MRVIGTVGLPGSGKGEAAAVAQEEGIPVVTMGDVIREETRKRGLDPEDHGRVARALREEEGTDAIARRSIPMIEDHLEDHDTVLVDGLRSGVEVDCFLESFGEDFTLVSIEAPFEARAARLAERERDLTDSDRDALMERERRELEFGMDDAMGRADIVIKNTDDLETYRQRVRKLFNLAATDDDTPGDDTSGDDTSDGGIETSEGGDGGPSTTDATGGGADE